jgi:electron transfer flavoprotein alpha subunit
MRVLVVTEQRQGKWNPVSWETLVAGQQLARQSSGQLLAAVVGHNVGELAGELAGCALEEVYRLDHPLLEPYTADGFALALEQLIARVQPELVLFPHTYQVRDFAPLLSVRLERGLVADCVGYRLEADRLVLVRQMFQGRVHADVSLQGPAPWLISFQAGAFRSDSLERRPGGAAPVQSVPVELRAEQIRVRPQEPFREARQAVDLTQAPIIVAVGRGIKEKANLALAERLAQALGGELAASRPVCDEGWLPLDRQIGSSGQTVAPRLYIALGISGAIQHVVGMKGSRTVVAINKDPHAPIFEVADYGIVGDLFEIVPALLKVLEEAPA